MTFTLNNWSCVSASLAQGQETITPYNGSPTVEGSPNLFTYGSPNDTVATISAANYFLPQHVSLSVGDLILGSGTDATFSLIVTAVSSTSVTTASTGLTTSIGTANIINGAITTSKLAANAVTSATVSPLMLQYVAVPISSTAFLGMYATPIQLVAAAGANTLIVLDKLDLLETYNSAAYAAGGTVAVQYDSTANGAGVIASSTLANTVFQGTVSAGFPMNMGTVTQTFSTCVNKGLYLSNITAAFTTGNSAFVAHVWYKVIPTV